MKTKTLLALLIVSTICILNVQSQPYFAPASGTYTDNTSGASSSSVNNTGNDRRWFGNTNVTLNVNVWDGNSPGIGWDDDNGHTGTLSLAYSDAVDPDVCLVAETSSPYIIYAIVAYYSPGQGRYYYQPFRWSFSLYTFSAGAAQSFQAANCFGNTINIDGDTYEHFAIVWDMLDASSGCSGNYDVWCVTGYVGPGLYCSSTPQQINDYGSGQYGMMPDVALYDQTGIAAYEQIVITYVLTSSSTTSPGDLEVDDDIFNNFSGCSPAVNRNIYGGVYRVYDYYYPRIASVNGGLASLAWTVVLEDNDGSSNYLIAGWTLPVNGNPVTNHIYNDGSATNCPGDISTVVNLRPAVTYDDQDAYVYVGWTYDNSGGGWTGSPYMATGDDIYPIVLLCDANGDITNNALYLEKPNTLSPSGDVMGAISIAGRYDRNYLLFTHYFVAASDVYYKLVPPSVTPLRKETAGPVTEETLLFPNPNDGNFTIEYQLENGNSSFQIYTTLGEIIYSKELNKPSGQQNISLKNLPSGIYYYAIKNENETFSGKFIKQ
jgi:hypothetical protein